MINSLITMPKKPTVDRNLLISQVARAFSVVVRVAILYGREKSEEGLKTETPTRMAGLASHKT